MADRPDAQSTAPDWEAVERDFRTGRFTLRELEAKHHVGYASISRKAKRDLWTKDLRGVIKAATNQALLLQQVKKAQQVQTEVVSEVFVAAEVNKQVILQHRTDIASARAIAQDLMGELRLTTHRTDLLEAAFDALAAEMAGPAAENATRQFRDFLRLHNRIASAHKLADTLAKLQAIEREAFGLDDDQQDQAPELSQQLTEFLSQLHEQGTGRIKFAPRVVGGKAA